MAKCEHRKKLVIKEYWRGTHSRLFENLVPVFGSVEDEPTGRLRVQCKECGLDKEYSFRKIPKWVWSLLESK